MLKKGMEGGTETGRGEIEAGKEGIGAFDPNVNKARPEERKGS